MKPPATDCRHLQLMLHGNPLLTPNSCAASSNSNCSPRAAPRAPHEGERRSRARGQSVEFADYRNYVHGDDFRYLDWNLYGRLDRLFLKLYEEERELPVRIFLDASESMTFGEPRKFDFARQVAAAIGYVALCGFDRVSVIPFPERRPAHRGSDNDAAAGPIGAGRARRAARRCAARSRRCNSSRTSAPSPPAARPT